MKTSLTYLLLCLFTLTSFGQQFKASFTSTVFDKTFTGRVIVYMSKENKEPKSGATGLENFPCFSVAVEESIS